MMDTFLELLRNNEYIDCELIVGGCEMPATFIWDEDSTITDYGIEKFKDLMESKFTRLLNGNIEIHCDNSKIGKDFCWAVAGYIGESESIKIFGE